MAEWMPLTDAVAAHVRDGDVLAMEGFTHLIPFAAGHEIIRQRKRNLSLIRMTPDLIYDQLIGAGCARKLTFSWGGNPGVGSLHRFRDAVENEWPGPLEIEERSHSDLANAYVAGASGLPFAVLRGYTGSDFPRVNPNIRSITCPFTGETLAATPAVRPTVTVIHAQEADRQGNVHLWGILGVQKEAALASERVIITVERRVHSLNAAPNACILPHWVVSAVCEVPRGATPSYAHGFYERDNAFYRAWDQIARERERFRSWIEQHILHTEGFDEYLSLQRDPRIQAAYQ
jgi:glutaconate CoA-transferase subunit A